MKAPLGDATAADSKDDVRAALDRLVKAWDAGSDSDASRWAALDREINAALEQARAALEGDSRIRECHVFRNIDPDAKCPDDGFPAWAHDPATAVMHEWRVPARESALDEPRLRAALDAVADELNNLDAALDDTHPEGDDCDICRQATRVQHAWNALISVALAPGTTDAETWNVGYRRSLGHRAAEATAVPLADAHADCGDRCECFVRGQLDEAFESAALATPAIEPGIDPERLATALHKTYGFTFPRGRAVDWASDARFVAEEYRRATPAVRERPE